MAFVPLLVGAQIFLCGGAGEWLYRSVLGVAPTSHGWNSIAVRPQVSATGPTTTNGSVHTIRGTVSVAWSTSAPGYTSATVAIGQLDVTIPAGTTAIVEMPVPDSTACTVNEGGKAVWSQGKFVKGVAGVNDASSRNYIGTSGDTLVFDVSSGSFSFRLKL